MAAGPTEDAWLEIALIAISKIGGSDLQFAGLTETMDIDLGDKDIEGIPIANGGRVVKWTPEADSSVTFEAYPLEAGTDTGTVGKGYHDLMHSTDATVPVRILNDHNRDKHRILMLWTNDPTVVTAQSITTDTFSALRIGLADAYFTSVKPSFTDGILKYTIIAKCAAFDKSNDSNVMVESCAGTTASDLLPVIAAYTTSNKFA